MMIKNKRLNNLKTCVIKRRLKSEDYKNCLKESHVENEISFLSKKYDFVKLINLGHNKDSKVTK